MNLFLCSTPLQLKIASRIIEDQDLERIVLLFTGILPNTRNQYYLDQIKHKGLVDRLILFDKNKELKKRNSAYLQSMAENLITNQQLEIKAVYLANINNRFYHHLLSLLPSTIHLYTYDDGTENINQESKFFKAKQYSKIRKFFQRKHGRRFWLDEVLAKTEQHFTIYKNLPNVAGRRYYLPLYTDYNFGTQLGKEITILLGSPYKDVVSDRRMVTDLISQLEIFVKECQCDLYLPHPREETINFSGCRNIIPSKMSEEVILDYLKQGYEIKLYGFGGSVQLNLEGINNISNYLLESHLLSDRVRNGYSVFNKQKLVSLVGF